MVHLRFGWIHNTVFLTEDVIAEIMETQILYLLRNLFALPVVDWECFDQLQALALFFHCLHVLFQELLELN